MRLNIYSKQINVNYDAIVSLFRPTLKCVYFNNVLQTIDVKSYLKLLVDNLGQDIISALDLGQH